MSLFSKPTDDVVDTDAVSDEEQTVSFQNEGVLDVRAVTTFGVNVKDNDSAIGYFGTGLKYAIAVLLREHHEIVICTDEDVYQFYTLKENIRGKDFDLVYMNGQHLGFTLELGKNWELWQAFRELYCNTTDERGNIDGRHLQHSSGKTTIYVHGRGFYNSYLKRDEIILMTSPIRSIGMIDIHPGSTNYVFYRNIRVAQPDIKPKYVYNIRSGVTLTEDRTVSSIYSMVGVIGRSLCESIDKELIESIVLSDNSYLESRIDFNWPTSNPTEEFLDVVEENRLNPRMNRSAVELLKRYRKTKRIEPTALNDLQAKQLNKAIDFCKQIGYNVDRYPIVVSEELKDGLMGMAKLADNEIYLSPDNFNMGTKYLAATLIEEYLHILTGFDDCTRSLQDRLFQDIVTLGERLTGEPV